MIDFQRALDAFSDGMRDTRSRYHLTLGGAIAALEDIAPSTACTLDIVGTPGKVDSYRGYYADLAFAQRLEPTTVGDVLSDLKGALNSTFEGYKGGDFVMGPNTPLWVSDYGMAEGIAVIDLRVIDGRAVFITRKVD